MTTLWTRADYDDATASDDAVRARDAAVRARDAARRARVADAFLARGGDAAEADEVARRTVEAWDAASYDFDSGRTMVYDAAHTADNYNSAEAIRARADARAEAINDASRAYFAASRAAEATPTTASIHATPTTPTTTLERMVAVHGVDAAFKMWAASRRGTRDRYSAAYRDAIRARADALHTEMDAIADAKEARRASRAARANVAEARAKVASVRAADARARV